MCLVIYGKIGATLPSINAVVGELHREKRTSLWKDVLLHGQVYLIILLKVSDVHILYFAV